MNVGRAVEMGEVVTVGSLDDERATYPLALVIEFRTREALKSAIESGECRFGAFTYPDDGPAT